MSLSPPKLNICFFFNEENDSVKSPHSNEPIKSDFGLHLMFGRINEKILYHKVMPTLPGNSTSLPNILTSQQQQVANNDSPDVSTAPTKPLIVLGHAISEPDDKQEMVVPPAPSRPLSKYSAQINS